VFVCPEISRTDALFVAGFAQAEGHFAIHDVNAGQSVACTFSLRLRDDDTELVGWLQDVTGLGSIRPIGAQRTSAPQCEWRIGRRSDVLHLSRLLTRYPMHGRKACEFAAWQRAVMAWNEEPPDRDVMRAEWDELLRRRAYEDPPDVDITLPPLDDLRHYVGGPHLGRWSFLVVGRAPVDDPQATCRRATAAASAVRSIRSRERVREPHRTAEPSGRVDRRRIGSLSPAGDCPVVDDPWQEDA
jgi:hypothetical protein